MAKKRKRRKTGKKRNPALKMLSIILIVIILLSFAMLVFWDKGLGDWANSFGTPVVRSLDLSGITSDHAILIHAQSGREIGNLDGDAAIYPASMTKIMTAVLALEHYKDLSEMLTFSIEDLDGLYEENASLAGYTTGEIAPVKDIIYGVLLPSGAECCNILSREIAGDTDTFLEMMNKKATEIGMEHTHFSNTTGLHQEDHYSTCHDMALLLKYALKNKVFREIAAASSYMASPTNVHENGLFFSHSLLSNLSDPYVTGGRILGGKTGYTQEAGYCLASFAEIEGREYILVTAEAYGGMSDPHIQDALTIYNRLGTEAQRIKDN